MQNHSGNQMSLSINHKEAERHSRVFSSTRDATGRWVTTWELLACPAKRQWVIVPAQRVAQIACADRRTTDSMTFNGEDFQQRSSGQGMILTAHPFALIAHAVKTSQRGLQSIALSPLSTSLCSLFRQSSGLHPHSVGPASEPARAVRTHAQRNSAMHSTHPTIGGCCHLLPQRVVAVVPEGATR